METTEQQTACAIEAKRICRILNINLNYRSKEQHIASRRHVLVWHLSRIYASEFVAEATGYSYNSVRRILLYVEALLDVKDKDILFLMERIGYKNEMYERKKEKRSNNAYGRN